MMNEEPTDTVRVRHVGMACYLWFRGHHISQKTWVDGFCYWDFLSSQELHDDMAAFDQGKATVDPKDYFHRVSEFKQKMYVDKPPA